MLQKQTTAFTFQAGVNTKADPKTLQGALVKCQDGFFQTTQMVRKRYGYTALPTSIGDGGGALASGQFLSAFQNEVVMGDGSYLYGFSQSQQAWLPKASFTPTEVGYQSVYHSDQDYGGATSAYSPATGLVCYATGYGDRAFGVSYTIMDSATGQAVVKNVTGIDGTGVFPKVFLLGSYFIIVWYNISGALKYIAIPTSNPFTSSSGTITSSVYTSDGGFAMEVVNNTLYVAYSLSSSTIGIRTVSSSLAISAQVMVSGMQMISFGALSGDSSNNVYLSAYDGTLLNGVVYNAALTSQLLPPTPITGAIVNVGPMTSMESGGVVYTYFTATATNPYDCYIYAVNWSITGAGTADIIIRSLQLASSPFVYEGIQYVLATYNSVVQPVYLLLQVVNRVASVVARIAMGLASPMVGALTDPWQNGTTWNFAVTVVDQTLVTGNKYGYGTSSVTFGGTPQAVQAGNNLLIAGGVLTAYDGQSVTELNFHVFPEQSAAPTVSTTGGHIGVGTALYSAVYEWTDCQGQLSTSTPSTGVSATTVTGSTNQVTITIPTLRVTSKAGVVIALYRTAFVNDGTVFYRIGEIANDTSADIVSYVDSAADASIVGNNQLYTTGGEVPDSATPAVASICLYNNRLIAVTSEQPDQFWYSKQVLPGFPVEMSAYFTDSVDANGGPMTAGAQMDGNLVLFKEGAVGYITGNGPAPSGANNDYSDWQPVAGSDEGAISPASVVLTPQGLMFQSSKGIMLLERSLAAGYIGAPVEAYVQGNTVVDARLVPAYNQARFLLNTGICVVYDYLVNQWYTYTDHQGVQACLYQGVYTYVKANGTALQETAGTFEDAGTFYPLLVQTPWLNFAGIQGYQRVYELEVLGDWKSAHTLQIQVARDFNSAIIQTVLVKAPTAQNPYQNRVRFQIQKCESLQLTIQDVQTTGTGEALDLSGLSFVIGALPGRLNKVPATNTY